MSGEAAPPASIPPPNASPKVELSAESASAHGVVNGPSIVGADHTTSSHSQNAVIDHANTPLTPSYASTATDPSPTAAVDTSDGAAASAPTATGAPVSVGTPVQLVQGKTNSAGLTAISTPSAGIGGGIQVVAPSSFLRRPTPVRVHQANTTGAEGLSGVNVQQRPGSASGAFSPSNSLPAILHSHSNSIPRMTSQRAAGSPIPHVGSPASRRTAPSKPMSQIDREQIEGLDFSGIYTCSVWDRLDTIFDTVRKSRVHRLVIIDENSKLAGVLTLSDILEYVLFHKEESEGGELD